MLFVEVDMKRLGITFDDLITNLKDGDQDLYLYFKQQVQMMDLDTHDYYDDMEPVIGGYIYLVETPYELSAIQTTNYNSWQNRYETLNESASVFDVCDMIAGKYYYLSNLTNNAGGNAYVIPVSLANENVKRSYELTMAEHDADH